MSEIENEFSFEDLIDSRFANEGDGPVTIADERLQEMSKKLPDWSLEPPYTYLK